MFLDCLVTLPMCGESLNLLLGIPLGALGNLSRMTDSFRRYNFLGKRDAYIRCSPSDPFLFLHLKPIC